MERYHTTLSLVVHWLTLWIILCLWTRVCINLEGRVILSQKRKSLLPVPAQSRRDIPFQIYVWWCKIGLTCQTLSACKTPEQDFCQTVAVYLHEFILQLINTKQFYIKCRKLCRFVLPLYSHIQTIKKSWKKSEQQGLTWLIYVPSLFAQIPSKIIPGEGHFFPNLRSSSSNYGHFATFVSLINDTSKKNEQMTYSVSRYFAKNSRIVWHLIVAVQKD